MSLGTSRSPGTDFDAPVEHYESRDFLHKEPRAPRSLLLVRRYRINVDIYASAARYTPLPLDAPDEEFPEFFHVEEKIERQEDKILWFTRTFASIPGWWTDTGFIATSIPAIDDPPTLASPRKTISGFASSIPNATTDSQSLTVTSNGYSVGDKVNIVLSFTGHGAFGGYRNFYFSGDFEVKAQSTNAISVNLGRIRVDNNPVYGVTSLSGTVAKYTAGHPSRPVQTKSIPTTIERDYFLPGISVFGSGVVQSRSDIPLPSVFSINKGTEDPDTFADNTLSANTVPTAAQYWSAIQNRSDLIAEAVIEPYLGNIVCRRITKFTAR